MYEFKQINQENFKLFHDFMNDYYRDGEDSDTAQDKIDGFIKKLFDLIQEKSMFGVLAYSDDIFIGIVIWMKDTIDHDFSVIPGYGTIAEIGIIPSMRKKGLGCVLVEYAEKELLRLDIKGIYVIAYGAALNFWQKRGYIENGQIASNGLTILAKDLKKINFNLSKILN